MIEPATLEKNITDTMANIYDALIEYMIVEGHIGLLSSGIAAQVPVLIPSVNAVNVRLMAYCHRNRIAIGDKIGIVSSPILDTAKMIQAKQDLSIQLQSHEMTICSLKKGLKGLLDEASFYKAADFLRRTTEHIRIQIGQSNDRSFDSARSDLKAISTVKNCWSSFFSDIADRKLSLKPRPVYETTQTEDQLSTPRIGEGGKGEFSGSRDEDEDQLFMSIDEESFVLADTPSAPMLNGFF